MFQSTRPVRSATASGHGWPLIHFVSIHAPRTERDSNDDKRFGNSYVSIHAPRTERDIFSIALQLDRNGFNPRAPYGARRMVPGNPTVFVWFQSTRPVRSATDTPTNCIRSISVSIHAPRTERDKRKLWIDPRGIVSIHAPRTERDGFVRHFRMRYLRFQSTRPVRSATGIFFYPCRMILFQSTRPVRSATYDRY